MLSFNLNHAQAGQKVRTIFFGRDKMVTYTSNRNFQFAKAFINRHLVDVYISCDKIYLNIYTIYREFLLIHRFNNKVNLTKLSKYKNELEEVVFKLDLVNSNNERTPAILLTDFAKIISWLLSIAQDFYKMAIKKRNYILKCEVRAIIERLEFLANGHENLPNKINEHLKNKK
jgi:hypothetical protein